MGPKWIFAAVFLLMLCASSLPTVMALDWYVKPDGNNANDGSDWENAKQAIQAAINAASFGDVINVASGTYLERLKLKDGITILGEGAEITRIEHNGSFNVIRAVDIRSGEISGFTIAYKGYSERATIFLKNSSLTISKNIITGAQYSGIEIAENSAPMIIDNEIRDNKQAGIFSYSGARGIISGNAISSNGLDGIVLLSNSYPQIINNTITNNNTNGIWVAVGSSPSIFNNIIVGNAEYGIDTDGYNYGGRGRPAVLFNDVWGNGWTGYNGIDKPPTDISADPLFVDPESGDYHLQPGSPCLGAADDGSDLGMYSEQRVTAQSLLTNITSSREYWRNGILTVRTEIMNLETSISNVLFQYSLDGRT